MTNNSRRRRRASAPKRSRIEQLAASIEKHLTALDRATDELDAEAESTDALGYTLNEAKAIQIGYTITPMKILLLATRIIIDGMPEDSGLNRDRILEMAQQWDATRPPPCQMAGEILDLLRKCVDYLEENTPVMPDDETGLPLIH